MFVYVILVPNNLKEHEFTTGVTLIAINHAESKEIIKLKKLILHGIEIIL